jgi:hypothetical protein
MSELKITFLRSDDLIKKVYPLRYSNINLEENKKTEKNFLCE